MKVKSTYLILLNVILFHSCESVDKNEANQNKVNSVYLENCNICHGEDGKKQVSGAKDLSISRLSDELVRQAIINGNTKAGMPAYGSRLSPVEIDSLVSYVIRLRTQKI